MMFRRLLLISLILGVTAPVRAEVVRIEVKSRTDVLSGKAFGNTGPYERVSGKIYFAVDPKNSTNRIVADIDKAPKNTAGKVEFSSDFYLIKPKDPSRGNGTILYEVSNRGTKGLLGFFNMGTNNVDPQAAGDFGDGFLMGQGFTLLWVGWQFDAPNRDGMLRVYVPAARESNGRSIQGLVRSDFTTTQKASDVNLPDSTYAVIDPKDTANALTVRDSVEGTRRTIPRTDWDFTADAKAVRMASGFEPNKIYEVVYRSQDPPIAGLGPAAVRDAISRLKYSGASELSINPGAIQHAIAFGISQSGRFLRTYLYYGFNEDESHRKVFDGIMSHVAGSGRGSFDNRFALPSRTAGPFSSFFYPVDIFPFTDVAQLDPESGRRDGLLTHHMKPEFMPKVMYTNSSHEYWGRAASLFTTTIDGKEDAPMMPNVRAYMYTGGNHTIGAFPPTRGSGQQLNDPLDYRWAARKLMVSLNRWITEGVEPPASAYPRVSEGTLVSPDKVKFAKIPNLAVPTTTNIHKAYRVDYGPEFGTKGIVSQEPPKVGSAFPMLVPQVDADGNDLPGIHMPEIAVPLATYLGWNFMNERTGPADELASLTGSFIPFARTRADRERNNDPRLSIAERYKSKDAYLELITKSANDLALKGYVMKEDIPRIVQQAAARWDWVTGNPH
ncbi:MAG TPA: alpha/beta hydrolase domain-containing protein [Terriglobia bacterium]